MWKSCNKAQANHNVSGMSDFTQSPNKYLSIIQTSQFISNDNDTDIVVVNLCWQEVCAKYELVSYFTTYAIHAFQPETI